MSINLRAMAFPRCFQVFLSWRGRNGLLPFHPVVRIPFFARCGAACSAAGAEGRIREIQFPGMTTTKLAVSSLGTTIPPRRGRAVQKLTGDNARKGTVKQRTQLKTGAVSL